MLDQAFFEEEQSILYFRQIGRFYPAYIPRYSNHQSIRWTGLLQKKLGSGYHIIEEGLCGRTTVFQDELREGRRGLDLIGVTVEMHNPIDLMIIMLGTNDCKITLLNQTKSYKHTK